MKWYPMPDVCINATDISIADRGFGGRRQHRDVASGHIWQSTLVADDGPLNVCVVCLEHKPNCLAATDESLALQGWGNKRKDRDGVLGHIWISGWVDDTDKPLDVCVVCLVHKPK